MSAAKEQTKVKITLPMLENNRDPEVFVGFNGKAYLIKRGEEVEVPVGVYHVLEKSRKAKEALIRSAQAAESNGSTT